MYQVQKIDGANLVTDKGCVSVAPFSYADGGKSQPVSRETWLAMRQLFVAAPDLLEACKALTEMLEGYDSGFTKQGEEFPEVAAARAAIAKAAS